MVIKMQFGGDIIYTEFTTRKITRDTGNFVTLASISNSVVKLPKETQERFNISPNCIPDGYDSWEQFFDCYKEMKKNMEKL